MISDLDRSLGFHPKNFIYLLIDVSLKKHILLIFFISLSFHQLSLILQFSNFLLFLVNTFNVIYIDTLSGYSNTQVH